MKQRITLLLTPVVLALVLTGCGDKADKKVATQVAAKVGSEEISVHQINQVLARTNTANTTPQGAQALRREVLEKLIDQQLAVDQATESKLHRSPDIVAQVEAVRREVLARAYIQQVTAALPKPNAEETKKYYVEHPQLFSERRVFNIQELIVPASVGPQVADQMRGMLAAGKTMEELAAMLRSKDIKFGGGAAQRAAEQIPLELLGKVHALKDGQATIISTAQAFTVIRIASSQSAPVAEAAALPRIEQFLANQRGVEAVTKNLKDLRAKAGVTYMGDFAQAAGAVGAASAAAPPASAAAGTTAAAAAAMAIPLPPAVVAPTADGKTKTAIEKGVAAMK